MKAEGSFVPTAALIGLCWAAVSGAAQAESNTALLHAAMRDACNEQGGRFERSWSYNDQGMKWGEILTCATSAGYVKCQGKVCQSGRWVRRDGATATGAGPGKNDGAVQFPAEPAGFSAALAALAGK